MIERKQYLLRFIIKGCFWIIVSVLVLPATSAVYAQDADEEGEIFWGGDEEEVVGFVVVLGMGGFKPEIRRKIQARGISGLMIVRHGDQVAVSGKHNPVFGRAVAGRDVEVKAVSQIDDRATVERDLTDLTVGTGGSFEDHLVTSRGKGRGCDCS